MEDNSHRKILVIIAVAVGIISLVGVGYYLIYNYVINKPEGSSDAIVVEEPMIIGDTIPVTLNECVDGDTFSFTTDTTSKNYRLLAVDAPELSGINSVYGDRAANYACKLLEDAETIEVQYDELSDVADKYNRDLVWVWVDGELLQYKLVINGYAETRYMYDNYTYNKFLVTAQSYAQSQHRMIWSSTNALLEDR